MARAQYRRFPTPVTSTRPPERSAKLVGFLLGAAPTVAFLTVNAITGTLTPALAAAGLVAAACFAWKLLRRERLRQALPGLAIVAVCASVAAATGQARGFFLVPTMLPFAVIAGCAATIATNRPLTGLLLNRVAGGPPDWPRLPRLRRVYVVSTLAAIAINVVNAVVQVAFYRADDPLVLGAAHVATGPIFATLVAVTLVYARRAIIEHRSQAPITTSESLLTRSGPRS